MSASRRVSLGLAALALGVGLAVFIRSRPEPVASDVTAPAAKPDASSPTETAPAPRPVTAPTGGETAGVTAPTSAAVSLPSGDAALEAINELAITYDAQSVPALARYLGHADAEIRAAAREGLVQLGERAAVPFLQEAARHAVPEEARALLEAAEFLTLPTWTERREALKAARTPSP